MRDIIIQELVDNNITRNEDLIKMIEDSIWVVRSMGKQYFLDHSTAGPALKEIIFKLAK